MIGIKNLKLGTTVFICVALFSGAIQSKADPLTMAECLQQFYDLNNDSNAAHETDYTLADIDYDACLIPHATNRDNTILLAENIAVVARAGILATFTSASYTCTALLAAQIVAAAGNPAALAIASANWLACYTGIVAVMTGALVEVELVLAIVIADTWGTYEDSRLQCLEQYEDDIDAADVLKSAKDLLNLAGRTLCESAAPDNPNNQ